MNGLPGGTTRCDRSGTAPEHAGEARRPRSSATGGAVGFRGQEANIRARAGQARLRGDSAYPPTPRRSTFCSLKPDGADAVQRARGPGGERRTSSSSCGCVCAKKAPHLRHLPGPSAAGPVPGGEDRKAEIRPPGGQPAGAGPADRAGVSSPARTMATRWRPTPCRKSAAAELYQRQRRHLRGDRLHGHARPFRCSSIPRPRAGPLDTGFLFDRFHRY